MIVPRRSGDRGHADHGWLSSRHTFSFADYHDPRQMGFRALRVINEDRVKPGMGFGTHPHKDMEIISWVLEGGLAHKDSLGSGSVIRPGDLQRMSAGQGVLHSEFNASSTQDVHFLQIWILPQARGLPAGYEQKRFEPSERSGRLRLLASRDGRDGSVTVHQDLALHGALLEPAQEVAHALSPGRHAWVQVARGAVRLNGEVYGAGDGAAVSDEPALTLRADQPSEVLLFDLA